MPRDATDASPSALPQLLDGARRHKRKKAGKNETGRKRQTGTHGFSTVRANPSFKPIEVASANDTGTIVASLADFASSGASRGYSAFEGAIGSFMASGSVRTDKTVLILGAGINGAATARELVLNGVPVVLVDAIDVAAGATSKSSRLIHGGLRYLEYGEFDLVRESLAERTRLFRLAPQFVHPLRFFIPVRGRLGGLVQSARRFLNLGGGTNRERGQWLVRMGLWMYDTYARDATVPRHSLHRATEPGVPAIDRDKYPWACAYTDGQIEFPERLVLAMLEDARQFAEQNVIPFQVCNHHRVHWSAGTARVEAIDPPSLEPEIAPFRPALLVNATGAWGDFTLEDLGVNSRRLFGGTKGSHFLTFNARLRELLRGRAIYAEASDGRLVFVLPVGDAVFVGTTDEPFEGRPEAAIATDQELAYLVSLVNEVVPTANITQADIAMHYSGVRPLPHTDATTTNAITRRHWIQESESNGVPLLTLIGGKLTTFRSLGEQTADRILDTLSLARVADSRDRVFPGGENYPTNSEAVEKAIHEIAQSLAFDPEQVRTAWRFVGTRAREYLDGSSDRENVPGTSIPIAFARQIITREWVHRLVDLVERRLMLIYQRDLGAETLRCLAELLADAGKLDRARIDAEIATAIQHLRKHYGLFTPGGES